MPFIITERKYNSIQSVKVTMRNITVVFLVFISLVLAHSLIKRPGVNYCTMGVVVIRQRVMCDPLRSLWVLRDGKCKEALHCVNGYSKKQCEENCLKRKITVKPKPVSKPKPKPKPPFNLQTGAKSKRLTTCATTQAEIKRTTEQYGITTRGNLPSTRETRRPKRTRRTRRYEIKEIC
ncbi:uncharacterized protein LOC119549665 [Drosophila subpulchrella]|uniref:uncharacterized protein LOC119549665 n=1 Tax=Drosophila subpulchrella TaxID=1486046 RepID=UPI0018A1B70B|nr:uncharacterized protein LOC119549665 [Drosophila subpulchrella]